MSWIKPNFLWMMYRSGWGAKPGQQVILAIALTRSYFDAILENGFPSTNTLGRQRVEWNKKIASTNALATLWMPRKTIYEVDDATKITLVMTDVRCLCNDIKVLKKS